MSVDDIITIQISGIELQIGADFRMFRFTCPTNGNLGPTRVLIEVMGVGVPPAEAGHFAAAKHAAIDTGAVGDHNGGVDDATAQGVHIFLGVALASAEDVADAFVVGQQEGAIVDAVADLTAADVDGHVAVVSNSPVCARVLTVDVHAGEGKTATTKEGAQNGTAIHGDIDVTRHTAIGVVGV